MVPNHARYHLRYTPKQLFYYKDSYIDCQEILSGDGQFLQT